MLTFLNRADEALSHQFGIRHRDAAKADVDERFAIMASLRYKIEKFLWGRPVKLWIIEEPAESTGKDLMSDEVSTRLTIR